MKARSNPFLVASLIIISAASIQATTLYWDGADTTAAVADANGGAGNWDTTLTNWNTAAIAGGAVAWPSSSTGDDDAVFAAAAGLVTIDAGGISANGITFETAGYSISGGILTLDGTSPGIAANASATVNAVIAGTGGLSKTGADTLVLTAANTYTGTTNIGGGSLSLSGASNRLAVAGNLGFSADGTLDLGTNSQTLSNLSITTATASTKGTITNGSLTFDGASALTLSPSVTTGGRTAEIDASGLSSLTIPKSGQTITVGGFAGGTMPGSYGTLRLSAVSNTITATNINVGTSGGANLNPTPINRGELYLGTTNTINADNWTIGNIRDGGIVKFPAELSNPSITLRGQDGTSAVTKITVGQNGAGGTGVGISSFELAAGSVDILVTDIVLARGFSTSSTSNTPALNGYFSIGGGTLQATNIWLSKNEAGGRNTTNTSHMYQLAGDVKASNLIFGTTTFTGTGGPVFNSQYTLTTGTLRAGDIRAGTGVFATTSTRRINFNGGTITHFDAASDLSINGVTGTGGTIGIALGTDGSPTIDVATGRVVTLGGFTSISGTGSLLKSGPGQLVMNNPANTATGDFRPEEGSVVVGSTNALAGQRVILDPADSGTLSFNGTTSIALGGLEGSRDLSVLNNLSATQDLTLGNATSASYTGEITGAKSIRKIGAGTQTYDPGSLHTASIAGMNISGGTLELNSGDYTVTGTASTAAPDSITGFVVSRGGTFRMNGANVTATSGTYLFTAGNTGGGNSSFILDSGTFNANGREVLNAYGADGTTTINGGLFICQGFKVSQSTTGILNLNGGILRPVYLYNGGSTVNFNGGTLQARVDRADFVATSITTAQIRSGGAVIDSNGFAITIPKVLTEDPGSTGGGLTKVGTGSLTLTAANTYTGPTLVKEGSLLVNVDHSGATGAVTVGDGIGDANSAIFGGTGSVPGAVTLDSDGAIAPGPLVGSPVGTFTASANVSGDGSLRVEVDGATADQLVVGGTLDISAMTLDLSTVNAPTENVYIIVNASSAITGAMFNAVTGSIPGYEVTYNYNDGVDSHNIALVGAPVSDPFDNWATTTNGLAGGDAAATADPDNDGLDNAVEFVIGGQPNPANANANSSGLAPTVGTDASNLIFTFRRTDLALTQPGIGITVEYGSDLSGWATATDGVNGVVITVNDEVEAGVDEVEVSIPKSLVPDETMFARLKVMIP